jgi:Tfp pilus assembly protein PilV
MRRQIPWNSKHGGRRHGGLLRMLTSSQAGFSIIEVVIGAVLVASIAGATATALVSTSAVSGDQRRRSQADEIAQQDQERLRGMSIKQLSGLNQVRTVGPYDGNSYIVTSTGKFMSSTGAGSCTTSGNGAAAFVRTTSSVTWADNKRPPVVQESVITPSVGGTLITNVVDQDGAPLSGVTVSATGPENETASTDSDGCTIMAALSQGDYSVTVSRSGYVDPDGNQAGSIPARPAPVSGTGTTFPNPNPFKLGQPGGISANFKTVIGATTYTGQKAASLSWANGGMSTPGYQTNTLPASGSPSKIVPNAQVNSWVSGQPFNLFPFNNGTPGVYTNNYTVWAGPCDAAKPPSNQSFATVPPTGWAILNDGGTPVAPRIRMPALILNVDYKPTSTTTTRVTPAAIKIRHLGCAGSDWWWPEVRPGAPTSSLGQLNFPGQPYAPNTAGQQLEICADYTPNGGTNYYRTNALFPPKTRNDDFTNGTTVTVTIDPANSWAQGRC